MLSTGRHFFRNIYSLLKAKGFATVIFLGQNHLLKHAPKQSFFYRTENQPVQSL